MKKFLVLLLALVLISSVFVLPVNATAQSKSTFDELSPATQYIEKLYEQYGQLPLKEGLAKYDELYYHTNEFGETDWALVYAHNDYGVFNDVIIENIVGGRKVCLPAQEYPFSIRYAVYDVKKDRFYNLVDLGPTDVFERYDGLYEVWQSLDLSEISFEVMCGDANGDGKVNIIDATYIQRYLTSLVSKYDIEQIASDIDKDGVVTIVDATRIQKDLAGLE